MSLLLSLSFVSCSNNEKNDEDLTKEAAVEEKVNSEDDYLQGEWAEDRTIDDLRSLFEEKAKSVEEVTKKLGVEYTSDEKIKNVDGMQITENAIYFDNENPEDNKMESMYFGMNIYGEDLESGDITLKLSLKFNSKEAIENGDFDIAKTSFVPYIEAFTGKNDKDYSNINNTIIERMKNGEKQVIVDTSTADGLKEEYLADENYIIYKLSTKKFVFADAEMSME